MSLAYHRQEPTYLWSCSGQPSPHLECAGAELQTVLQKLVHRRLDTNALLLGQCRHGEGADYHLFPHLNRSSSQEGKEKQRVRISGHQIWEHHGSISHRALILAEMGRENKVLSTLRAGEAQKKVQRLTQGVSRHPREDDAVCGKEDGTLSWE